MSMITLSALVAVVAVPFTAQAATPTMAAEKCYGIAKAGLNVHLRRR
jgi:uncharacterized membrane protein